MQLSTILSSLVSRGANDNPTSQGQFRELGYTGERPNSDVNFSNENLWPEVMESDDTGDKKEVRPTNKRNNAEGANKVI